MTRKEFVIQCLLPPARITAAALKAVEQGALTRRTMNEMVDDYVSRREALAMSVIEGIK